MNLFPFDLSPFYLDGYEKYYEMTLILYMLMHMVEPSTAEVSPFARFTFSFEDLKILNGLSATNYIFIAYADIIHTNINIDLRFDFRPFPFRPFALLPGWICEILWDDFNTVHDHAHGKTI